MRYIAYLFFGYFNFYFAVIAYIAVTVIIIITYVIMTFYLISILVNQTLFNLFNLPLQYINKKSLIDFTALLSIVTSVLSFGSCNNLLDFR